MLSFDREDRRWYLLTPSLTGGIRTLRVVNDDEIGLMSNMVIPVGDGGQASIN